MIRSELGLGPWDSFHVGLSQITGINVGTIMILVGLVVLIGAIGMGVRPGPGTIANMILIGVFTDLLLPIVPDATSTPQAWAFLLSGILFCGTSTGLYISAAYGTGPRDSLMVGVIRRSGWSVRLVRTLIEVSVLGLGWAMGGRVGVGTIAFTLLIGPTTQWGLTIFDRGGAAMARGR